MTIKPRFTLKAILGCTAPLCVTLAVCVVVDEFFAVYFVPLAVGGCVGYLLKGWRGLCTGVFVAIFATLLIGMPTGVRPDQWIDYQCLVGDSTDSIVGAKGIGPKTAVAILQTVGSLQAAFATPWKLSVTDRQRNNLLAFRGRVEVVRQLVTLRTDADLEWVP